jgi:hypothetical protein
MADEPKERDDLRTQRQCRPEGAKAMSDAERDRTLESTKAGQES